MDKKNFVISTIGGDFLLKLNHDSDKSKHFYDVYDMDDGTYFGEIECECEPDDDEIDDDFINGIEDIIIDSIDNGDLFPHLKDI